MGKKTGKSRNGARISMDVFCCPVCGQPLISNGSAEQCPNRHSFDRASEGYVNLLPSSKKNAKDPGDGREMIRARSRFLGHGYYACLLRALSEAAAGLLGEGGGTLLDAGCGEGYYTNGVCKDLAARGIPMQAAGFDLSKPAVRLAAKAAARDGLRAEYAVAGIFDIPVGDGRCDLVMNLFAPVGADEFRRVLKPDGALLIVEPGKRHLFGLKEQLYDRPYENEEEPPQTAGFTLQSTQTIRSRVTVEGAEDVQALFCMTPYYWHTPAESARRLENVTRLETEIEFRLHTLRRDG